MWSQSFVFEKYWQTTKIPTSLFFFFPPLCMNLDFLRIPYLQSTYTVHKHYIQNKLYTACQAGVLFKICWECSITVLLNIFFKTNID
uniref:Uncharacterized protein n=1 Tax=Seriola dumerili TaxID=41447 RepID=A0A3B4T7X1_SERDU